VLDHVTHIKKRTRGDDENIDEMEVDSPIKDEISEPMEKEEEIMSPDKGDESTDVEEETKQGCYIGFRYTDEL